MLSLRAVPVLSLVPLVFAACGACEPDHTPGPGASASASAPQTPDAPSSPMASSSAWRRPPRPQPRLPCRIIEGTGDARMETGPDASAPLLVQGLVPSNWVDVPAGARLVAKDPRTTRETTFRGAGRVKACVWADEESWIASGGFDSSVGSGEAPGNEEWVVTPVGVVRYGAAKLSVDVHARDARVVISSGNAFLWVPADATARGAAAAAPSKGDDGWMRADPGTFTLSSSGGTPPLSLDGARAAVAACSSLGKSAHDLSAMLLAGGADAGTVMSQVSTRRLARAACAVAGLRLGALPQSNVLTPLGTQLNEGMSGWNSLPEASASPSSLPP
jgi:hypothetical protein